MFIVETFALVEKDLRVVRKDLDSSLKDDLTSEDGPKLRGFSSVIL